MAEKLHLKIVTPDRVLFDGLVDEVLLPGSEGQLGILPGHIPLLAMLRIGELMIKQGDEWESFAILGGFVEVQKGGLVSVLADAAEHAEEIDELKALEAKKEAESVLAEKRDEVKFAEASLALEKAIALLKVAQRKRKHRSQLMQVPKKS
jgi:F-type H+-transporting ATPase subunit epsilon